MLRVLTLSTLFPDASRPNFGQFVARQTQALAAVPGVEVRVVAPIGTPPGPLAWLAPAGRQTVPLRDRWLGLAVERPRFVALPRVGGPRNAASLQRALRPVIDRLRDEFRFDVIDASFFYPDGPAAVALGARYGVPVSIKARGADIHHWGTARATAEQVRAAAVAADGMLAVSATMRDDMIALGMPAGRIHVHYTGVDQDRFRPGDRATQKAALGVAGPLVLSLGALIPRKGHDIVIDAVAGLPGVTLIIAGEGPERDRLAARAAQHGITDRVRLIGGVPHDDLPALIGAADVMALASRSEGLANAWVEAIACGTPVVISDAGGAREVVIGPDAGRIVPRTAAGFAGGIAAILADPPAAEATRAMAAPFTWAANGAALFVHLAGLVARGRGAAADRSAAAS
ncbi:glycosyltransferase [Sphingomonas sp. XXL09]|uniref:glycosyltransferase n=1 Tax=Sphingomonas sp. XXL09 TaxID=3457787 RepID=UPI00406BB660